MTFNRSVGAAAVALGLTLAAWGGTADAQEPNDPTPGRDGPAERTGQRAGARFDQLVRGLKENFRDLSDEVQQRFARARQSVDDLGVEARVYGRLHWDKALNQAEIVVEAREGGVVVLHGAVVDEEARAMAVRLASSTVGVDRVIDELTPAAAPPAAEPVTP